MNYSTVKTDIEQYLIDNWTATPIYFDNMEIQESEDAYIKAVVYFQETNFLSIGNTSSRRVGGSLTIDVYDLADTGSGNATALCQTLADLFTGANINSIYFKAPRIATNGAIEKFFWMTVFISFYYDVGV